MAVHSPLLLEGLRRHRAGDFQAAEAVYRSVLTSAPADPDALHLLGLLAHRCGRAAEAVAAIERAVALCPEVALYRGNLARVLNAAGRFEEARQSLIAAIALEPANADFHYEHGVVAARLGCHAEAVCYLHRAIALSPRHARAHNNLGSSFDALGRPDEAEAQFREAVRLEPALAEAHANLGALCCRTGRPAEAEASLSAALQIAPWFPEALNTLGTVLMARRDLERAEAAYRRALAIAPDYAEAENNLGVALTNQGRFDEALAVLRAVLGRKPRYAEAATNAGNVLVALGRVAEAVAFFRRALAIAPEEAETRYNLGLALLLAGRFRAGWAAYEWRFRRRGAEQRSLPQPLWRGEPLSGRVLLVHAEQGFGDTIQFCRLVAATGAQEIILEAPRPLVRLLATLPAANRVVVRGDVLPPADLHCPLMSLPLCIGTTLETIPRTVPYLFADPLAVAGWSTRLSRYRGLKVGLVWAGNPDYPADARRSIQPSLLAPLFAVAGAVFVSLQPAAAPPEIKLLSFPGELGDFADTAALVMALDLVISVDTAAVHLAGALGKPVWLLNRYDTCWRWLLDRTDSPWYPRLRQFRQPRPGDWTSALEAVKAALLEAVAEPASLGA